LHSRGKGFGRWKIRDRPRRGSFVEWDVGVGGGGDPLHKKVKAGIGGLEIRRRGSSSPAKKGFCKKFEKTNRLKGVRPV